MHKLAWTLVLGAVAILPLTAQAGPIVSLSLGKGSLLTTNPVHATTQQTNIMVTPGYELFIIRAELGIVADLPDVKGSEFNMQLRPMLVLNPPILPLYARLIFAMSNLLGNGDARYNLGGALGAGASLMGLGVFAEFGVIPNTQNSVKTYLLEGRAGASYEF